MAIATVETQGGASPQAAWLTVVEQGEWADTSGSGRAPKVVSLAVKRLRPGWTVRCELNERHVQALMEVPSRWPLVMVAEDRVRVIDGNHRLEAARRLGLARIEAMIFSGDDSAALIEAIVRNVAHGLPLSLAERKASARRVLSMRAEWSDGRIAHLCGLSFSTVAKLRVRISAGLEAVGEHAPTHRLGRDGKYRPVDPSEVRRKISLLLQEKPQRSLRQVAALTGASPETVRSVRQSLAVSVERSAAVSAVEHVNKDESLCTETAERWVRDSALRSTETGLDFAGWFDACSPQAAQAKFVSCIPLSRVYEVVDEARRRARWWDEFAEKVQARVR